MKKIIAFILFASLLIIVACELEIPQAPQLNIPQKMLLLNKMIAIGNSLTAGFQSAGLVEDFQLNSYPHLIAQQLKKLGANGEMEQPLIMAPGIGSTPGKTPMRFENGQIIVDDLTVDPATLLKNALLPRPYDNLGVPGADLNDVLNTTSGASGNPFFDIVLRNPNFANTTQLQQAITLNPTLIILWIGSNDVLGAALSGGDPSLITSQADFQTRMTSILTELRNNTNAGIVMGNIPNVTDIPFVNTMDIIFHDSPALGITTPVPVVFDATFTPVDFASGLGLYIPLLTSETNVAHLLLPALSAYQEGMGIPDSAALVAMGMPPVQAQAIEAGMRAAGLNPTGTPFPEEYSLTVDETNAIVNAVNGFNATIQILAGQFQVPVVDANTFLNTLNTQGLDGYTGLFVLLDPANTAFSLDGVHPNNGGYALVANMFIDVINQAFDLSIPNLNTADFKGQYLGKRVHKIALNALIQVKDIFLKKEKASLEVKSKGIPIK